MPKGLFLWQSEAGKYLKFRGPLERIDEYTEGGETYSLASRLVQDGVIRNLEVLGEATKNLSDDLRSANPEIPWRQIAGMRDVLINDYLRVNLRRVWQTVVCDLPPLRIVTNTLLAKGSG